MHFYSQIQECVSFVQVCIHAIKQNDCSKEEIAKIYNALCKWDNWYENNRMNSEGLFLTFCGYDTGHDNSSRLKDYREYSRSFEPTGCVMPTKNNVLPVISIDVNAVVYGNRTGLSELAETLGLKKESKFWTEKAEKLKTTLLKKCYDPISDFFYDVDKNGNFIPVKSISITSLFIHKLFDKNFGKEFFYKYFTDEKYFGTEYPYPSVATSDKLFEKNFDGNSWNYFSQGLTMLRSILWMKDYDLDKYFKSNMEKWVSALTENADKRFPQELDPFTGIPSVCSEYYSSTMLFYLYSIRELQRNKT